MEREIIRKHLIGALIEVDDFDCTDADMNEEISKMYVPDCFAERFARLIIEEAIEIVQRGVVRNGTTPENERTYQHVKDLKEHFGIK